MEDRRGQGMGPGLKVGGGLGLLVVILVVALLGGDPGEILELLGGASETSTATEPRSPPPNDEMAQFASAILASTEDAWSRIFEARGAASYRPATLVLFDDVVRSRCGIQGAATGPFYCPRDGNIYLDLGFFRQLERMGASGDFAWAYVIGHEVGHHVQNLSGTLSGTPPGADARRMSASERSVRIELQADCYAGVWAHHADRSRALLEEGDIEEGLRAAAAIGDDRLQGDAVRPETFTHGSSEQRMRWLRTGLEAGSVEACDTSSRELGERTGYRDPHSLEETGA